MPNANTVPSRRRSRVPYLTSVLLIALAIALAIVYPIVKSKQTEPLPTLSQVPSFALTDSTSHTFGTEQLKGKVWVATFFFTTCPTLCPIMMNAMSDLYKNYKGNFDVQFVAVTVNPQYDSPAILSEVSNRYHADPAQWHFLTGTLEAIQDLSLNGLKVGTQEDPINHSAYFVLVGQSGHIRGYYDGQDTAAMTRLENAIKQLLNQD
jgi:protein SCO1/2